VVHEDFARGDLLAALTQWRLSIFGRGMYMLYMPNRHHPRAIAMIIEFILERAQARHEGMPGLLAAAG
jgi:DNA-binding transcriptional LysR family regulator